MDSSLPTLWEPSWEVELRAKGQIQALMVARLNRRPCVMVLAFSTLVLVWIFSLVPSRSVLSILTQSSAGGGKEVNICVLDAPATVKPGRIHISWNEYCQYSTSFLTFLPKQPLRLDSAPSPDIYHDMREICVYWNRFRNYKVPDAGRVNFTLQCTYTQKKDELNQEMVLENCLYCLNLDFLSRHRKFQEL